MDKELFKKSMNSLKFTAYMIGVLLILMGLAQSVGAVFWIYVNLAFIFAKDIGNLTGCEDN
jgi:putative exporter of polyketide antibiotics